MILSFELPFALIPLLKFSSSSTKMGPHKNSIVVSSTTFLKKKIPLKNSKLQNIITIFMGFLFMQIIVISWILGLGIIGINVYYLGTGFVGWLLNNDLPKVGNVLIGIIVFPLMAIYVLSVIYLTVRKDTAVTFIEPMKEDPTVVQANNMEVGRLGNSIEALELDHVPYRDDLADIPLPK